jgi:hypothetical protein
MTVRSKDMETVAKVAALKLLDYCGTAGWAGYDPYDALNSRLFRALPFLDFRLARLAMTQVVKRSPINLRSILLIPKTRNSKGMALFLSSLIKLDRKGFLGDEGLIKSMAEELLAMRIADSRYASWGYSFDWQTRHYLVPKTTPNIICSTFAANSLLDGYERLRHVPWLEIAASTADFLLDRLFWREGPSTACFSYTPIERARVHNANLLGAALLCRVSRLSGDSRFLEPALDAARYSAGRQHEDGSWAYGEAPAQNWIDNFHTGFNLVALRKIREYTGTTEFEASIRRGFEFYKSRFFQDDGAPRYYHNASYPIDIHSAAQSIITLIAFADFGTDTIDLACSVLDWTLTNLRDRRGFFYYQKSPYYTIKIPYMRWSQAWMLNALSSFLSDLDSD